MKKQTRQTTKRIKLPPVGKLRLSSKHARIAILVAAIELVLCVGVIALVIQHTRTNINEAQSGTTSSAPYQAPSIQPTTATPAPSTSTPISAQNTPAASTSPTTKSSGSATTYNLPDQYGCIPQTSGYDACVKARMQIALMQSCDSQANTAYNKYSAVGDQEWVTRDAVLAEWKTVYARMVQQNYPLNAINSEEARYKKMAYTDTNAIIKPAYEEYVATLNTLRSQGCTVTTHSDLYSWPGY